MTDVTQILSQIEQGDKLASERLLPLLYDALRRLAAAKLANEKPGQTIQATALVHDAYVRLVGGDQPAEWNSRGHFYAAAAEAMRRILIENARRKASMKRGGEFDRITLDAADEEHADVNRRNEKLLALDEALAAFEAKDPQKAELVKLRFFAGLTNRDAAASLDISTNTADRYWSYARAWLQREMANQADP